MQIWVEEEEEGEDGVGKEAWKRKQMKKMFARFTFYTLMIHVVLFYRVRRQN